MNAAVAERTRLKVRVRGAVQGVGFRPFVFRLASALGLDGWVNNSAQGVCIEVEGPRDALENFLLRLETERPALSFIQSLEASWLDPIGLADFEIRDSEVGGDKTALVLPDIATCPDCVREIFDPENRRYFYPFTNCTHCGPRFSIAESLPYDRANTSMKTFTMCPRCRAEYEDPRDRRFHAQPNACPDCGPQIDLWDRAGKSFLSADPARAGAIGRSTGDAAGSRERHQSVLSAAAAALRAGRIVAVKGIGGFHLMVAAHHDAAVRRLRDLKRREEKPLALMFPSLTAVNAVAEVSPLEERLLRSPEAPIVLLRRRQSASDGRPSPVAPSVAPRNPNLGVMLPYAPLHHLLMSLLGFPVVATSGNRSDEPICTDEREAIERLGGIADLFLVHNRPIVRHVDDAIVRVVLGRELMLRRARGYAPLPITLKEEAHPPSPETILAVGAHLKNTVALSVGPQVFLSQHIGDLETAEAADAFHRVIADFQKLYEATPTRVAADAHPDYLSTRFARERVAPAAVPAIGERPGYVEVPHHIAHVLSCMAENELEPPVLGVSWDGTGYGLDGTIWGGEFFFVTGTDCARVAHLRQFRLPGGDKAVQEPRRAALGLLHELDGCAAFEDKRIAPLRGLDDRELAAIKTMLARRLNSPLTSSAGRLFDAVAALCGLRQQTRFEGQAAMELEFALEGIETDEAYPFSIIDRGSPVGPYAGSPLFVGEPAAAVTLDWAPMIEAILADVKSGVAAGEISAKFHNALAEMIVGVARTAAQERVVLSGGCFQNRYLTERAVRRLEQEGFRVYWHQRVPPNDGGIALGQVVAALREERKQAPCV